MTTSRAPLDIAVVGLAALFPGSTDARGFWQDILEGTDRITEVPPTHWRISDYYDPDPGAEDRTWCRRGGFLDPVDFPALELGVPPTIAPGTDTSQLLALLVARQVLDDACRGRFSEVDRERASVILGVTGGQELMGHLAGRLARPQWRNALLDAGVPPEEADRLCQRIADQFVPWQEASFPGLLGNVVAGRIAHRLDLRGTNCVVDAACASALSALAMACDELVLGHSDLVITGGVDTMNDPFMFLCFSKTPALSRSEECRPFDAGADGTLLGEGVGLVALKRRSDAERDGDRIYAVIRGVGSSSDGLGPGIYAPVPEGQARALRRAYAAAGYGPETVGYVEAHGTGTRAGDAAEVAGLRLVFEAAGAEPWCALGSVKAQVGHTKAAAGAAGLIKAVLALQHKVIPPAIKVRSPNPALDGGPFYLPSKAAPWVRPPDHPRRASVSAFGFGGSNFHVALEEYDGANPAERLDAGGIGLVLVGGADRGELIGAIEALAAEAEAGTPLRVLARRSQEAWEDVPAWRLAVLASDGVALASKLLRARDALASENGHGLSLPPGVWSGRGERVGKVAFLFPGQGSQSLEMGRELALAFPAARQAWDAAEAAWARAPRLSRVVFPPRAFDAETREAQARRLTDTRYAQPALAAASLAGLAFLRSCGLSPDLLLGHSFGELVALHAADAFDVGTLLALAAARGQAMHEAGNTGGDPGTMAAVLGDATRAAAALEGLQARGHGLGVVIANHNAPDQVVLAGPRAAVAEVGAALADQGFGVRPLPVAAAFHSPLVSGASAALAEALARADVRAPRLPVIGVADARPYPQDPGAVRERLAEQLARPVRFAEGLAALWEAGARVFVEVGPGEVLTGLARRALGPDAVVLSLDRPGDGLRAALETLGRLVALGLPSRPGVLWRGVRAEPWPRARPRGLTIPVSGTNLGRPNPPPNEESPPPASRARSATEETPMSAPPVFAPPEAAFDVSQPAAPAAVAFQGAVVPGEVAGALAAWAEIQRQTSATHVAFQQAMHAAHVAYLRAMETSFAGLAALAGVSLPVGAAPAVPVFAPAVPPTLVAPVVAAPTAPAAPRLPAPAAHAPAASAAPASRASRLPERPVQSATGSLGPVAAPKAAPAKAPAPAPAAAPAATAGVDLQALLLEVVADKTGYPAEMLELSMGLASDLGIDSIKRVEILSALRAKVPSLPELDMAGLASLRTLAQVLETLEAAGGSPSKKDPEPRRFLLEPVPLAKTAPACALPAGTRTLGLLRDTRGVAEALAGRLGTRGLSTVLFEVGEEAPEADGYVVLAGLGPLSRDEEPAAVVRAAFRAARALARRRRAGGLGSVFVTAQDTGGDFGLSGRAGRLQARAGGLLGLARTAAREWPDARVLALDLAAGRDADAVAATIEQELFLGDAPLERGHNGRGQRLGLVDREAPAAPRQETLRAGDVLVVTGGARGVTARCLRALARELPLKLVLLGRTPLEPEPPETAGVEDEAALRRVLLEQARAAGERLSPAALAGRAGALRASREARASVAALEAAGAEVLYLAVDVQDRSALSAGLARVRQRWGPIAGVVHGAGVLADALLADKEDAAFDRVFDTKVQGFSNLLAATAEDPLRLVAAFSSVAGRYGNAGQADYAAANVTLDQLCYIEAARRPGCRVVALGWGPWDGGMVTPELRAAFQSRGVPLLSPDLGAALFVEQVLTGSGPPVVVLGGRLADEAPAPAPRALRQELLINSESHPWLRDHQVQGVPVLPVVAVVELFARALAEGWPGLRLEAIEGLRVLRGLPLPELAEGHRLVVEAREIETGASVRVGLALYEASETRAPRYRAEAVLAVEARVPSLTGPPEGPLRPWEGDPYAEALFHGSAFRALSEVVLGVEGARATISPLREGADYAQGWNSGPWATDPRALDAALQLGLLWGWEPLGGRSLPTGIGALRFGAVGAWSGPIRATLRVVEREERRALFAISLTDGAGKPLATLSGVEFHAIPSAQRA